MPLKMIKDKDLRLNNLVMVNYKKDLLSKVTRIQEGSINAIFDISSPLFSRFIKSVLSNCGNHDVYGLYLPATV